jgi:Flp pilus assembly protein TadD
LSDSLSRPDEAIALTKFVVSRHPVNPTGHFLLGVSYNIAGRWDKAIASFRTALMLSPDSSGAQYLIGMALLLKGEPLAAVP